MNEEQIRHLLVQFSEGTSSIDQTLESLRSMPFEDLGFAKIDHHRHIRRGFPEVIYAAGKTPDQVVAIAKQMHEHSGLAIATRCDACMREVLEQNFDALNFDDAASTAVIGTLPEPSPDIPQMAVVTAGTSDIPVARQATLIARAGGCPVVEVFDVGVAGLHRLLHYRDVLERSAALVVVAGMEGALPSVVAGLVSTPVIAVPTSVGYGASFGGVAALLGMLNSCAGGIAVVNIDNGFGAGLMAGMICKQSQPQPN